MPIKYTFQLLQDYCAENKITLLKDYSKEKIKGKIKIEGRCVEIGCENTFEKSFTSLLQYENFYCKSCSKKYVYDKFKKTCLERYGVENILQSQSHREKIQNTNLKKYGVKYPLQNKEVIAKVQTTCMQKYGFINSFQVDEFKEKSKSTCMEKYGVENGMQNEDIREKLKKSNEDKYGVEYACQNEGVKEKIVQTNLKNHGVRSGLASKEIREKGKKTMLEKYGVENGMKSEIIKDRLKQTNIEKYGVENVFQSEHHKEKIKQTNLEKYGVENVMHDPEISGRAFSNMAKKKSYTFPSGKVVYVQGYEPFALDILIVDTDEEDIETNREDVPEIWYFDSEGIRHRHYVDIYIKSQNKCIEIKSEWTVKMAHCNVHEKQSAAKEKGYLYEIWVISEQGECIQKMI